MWKRHRAAHRVVAKSFMEPIKASHPEANLYNFLLEVMLGMRQMPRCQHVVEEVCIVFALS